MRSLVIAALVGLGACTSTGGGDPHGGATAASNHDCFLAASVNGYNIVDDHTVRIDVGPSHHYLLATTWDAHELNWSEILVLRSRGSDWICTGNGLGVEVRGGRPPRTYPITSVTREPAPNRPPEAHGS
jgi:hypothetical protein